MSRAAIRYAKAILDTATSKSVATNVSADMFLIALTIENNLELKTFIENPTINVGVKQNALLEVFKSIDVVSKSLFRLLFENKRFELLGDIASAYNQLFDEQNGIEKAIVTTATAIDSNLEKQILAKIATISNKKINLSNSIDPAIIGGFILRIGDKQFNASVANRLQTLKRELIN